MSTIYKDVTNKVFNTAREMKEKGISGKSITHQEARQLIESGQYEKEGNYVLRGDSDIRLHDGKILMWISRDRGHFQVIAQKRPTESMPGKQK